MEAEKGRYVPLAFLPLTLTVFFPSLRLFPPSRSPARFKTSILATSNQASAQDYHLALSSISGAQIVTQNLRRRIRARSNDVPSPFPWPS